MTSSQLAAVAYQLGAIDSIRNQLSEMTLALNDLGEGPLSVKLELAVRAFEERAEEHRKILNEYANETLISPTQNLQP
jgi:uncharacterized membrane protein